MTIFFILLPAAACESPSRASARREGAAFVSTRASFSFNSGTNFCLNPNGSCVFSGVMREANEGRLHREVVQ